MNDQPSVDPQHWLDPWHWVEDLINEAKSYKRLLWMDATSEIQFLDTRDQSAREKLQAEAITRELMEDDELRSILQVILLRRRSEATGPR